MRILLDNILFNLHLQFTNEKAKEEIEKTDRIEKASRSIDIESIMGYILLGLIVVGIVGSFAIWYLYDWKKAGIFFGSITFIFILRVVVCNFKDYLKMDKTEPDEEEEDKRKYGLVLEKASVKDLVEEFHIVYLLKDGNEFIEIHKHNAKLDKHAGDVFRKRKPEILRYIKQRQEYVDNYYRKLDAIPGLEKYADLYDVWMEYCDWVSMYKASDEACVTAEKNFGLPDSREIKANYPKAWSIMEGLKFAELYPQDDIGEGSIRKILNGEDYEKVNEDMKKYVTERIGIVDISPYSISMKKVMKAYLTKSFDDDVTY